mmetsp:Transcript_7567/g.17750  ORF Transcript_7567/g.17750 Transcript_7567/m.17750 type:complete len:113 (-) Transcript_7567:113-451(-)
MSGTIGPTPVWITVLAIVLASLVSPVQARMTAAQKRAHENYKRYFDSSDLHSVSLGSYHPNGAGRKAHSHHAQAKKQGKSFAERTAHKRSAARVQAHRQQSARRALRASHHR